MGFSILRMQKLKSSVAMKGSLKHSFREQDTPNADANLTHQNEHIGAVDSQEAISKYNALLGKAAAATKTGKIRKNAVMACEFLITASPEVLNAKEKKEQDAYFQDALKWLEDRHGKENIVCAGVHRDETTPHMYVYVVPRDPATGKLNCRKFYGGHKDVMSKLQTEFHEKIGKNHGLERGEKGSKAKHTKIKDYYTNINKAKAVTLTTEDLTAKITKKKIFKTTYETSEEYTNRLNKLIGPLNDAKKEKDSLAQSVKHLRKHNMELQKVHDTLIPEWATGKKGQKVYLERMKEFQTKNEKLIKAEIKKILRLKWSKQKSNSNDLGY